MSRRKMSELKDKLLTLAGYLRTELIEAGEEKRGLYLRRDGTTHRYSLFSNVWRDQIVSTRPGGGWVGCRVFFDDEKTVTELYDAVCFAIRMIQDYSLLPHTVIQQRVQAIVASNVPQPNPSIGVGKTVDEALKSNRVALKGKVQSLVLCKRQMFYVLKNDELCQEEVYPVTAAMVEAEAKHFGVPWQEE